jgi:uncharacterized protein YndB with AHSA1/START domain
MSNQAQTVVPAPFPPSVDATPALTGTDIAGAVSHSDIEAATIVPAPAGDVFAFLTDLENHWLVADRFVEVITLDGPVGARTGGMVALRGPLRLRRTARTRVRSATAPWRMAGTAEIGARTLATVRWTLDERGPETAVALAATVERAALLDRILLAAGGRRWLGRRFERTLNRLAAHFNATKPASQSTEGAIQVEEMRDD